MPNLPGKTSVIQSFSSPTRSPGSAPAYRHEEQREMSIPVSIHRRLKIETASGAEKNRLKANGCDPCAVLANSRRFQFIWHCVGEVPRKHRKRLGPLLQQHAMCSTWSGITTVAIWKGQTCKSFPNLIKPLLVWHAVRFGVPLQSHGLQIHVLVVTTKRPPVKFSRWVPFNTNVKDPNS